MSWKQVTVAVGAAVVVLGVSAAVLVGRQESLDPFSYQICTGHSMTRHSSGAASAPIYYIGGKSLLAESLSSAAIERTDIPALSSGQPAAHAVSGSSVVFRPPSGKVADALWSPSVNPAGTMIAYVRGPADELGRFAGTGEIVVAGLDAGRRITGSFPDGSDPVWSPDGRSLAFVRDDTITIIDPGGGHYRRLPAPGLVNTLSWSPNGRCIAASVGQSPARIAVIDVRSRQFRWFYAPGISEYYPAWSPSGYDLAFEEISPNGLFITNVLTGQSRELVACHLSDCTQAMWPAWSPDGKYVAFAEVNGGPSQIWLVSAVGGAAREVTFGPEQHSLPAW